MDYNNLSNEDLIRRIRLLESQQQLTQQQNGAAASNVEAFPPSVVEIALPPTIDVPLPSLATIHNNSSINQPISSRPTSYPPEGNDSLPQSFGDVDPDVLIEILKKCTDVGTNRRKEFYKTYGKWGTLKKEQKNNVVLWFENLSEDTKGSILEQCKAASSDDNKGEVTRTTKDDIARLLHLNRHPAAMVHWTNTQLIMNRQQLDSRNSNIPEAREVANPWECLANIFNDYVNFTPQNLMVKYIMGPNGKSIMKTPVQPEQEWKYIYQKCHDIEPTNYARAEIKRDGDWIKMHWTQMRRILSGLFENFNRSGRQCEKGDWSNVEELQAWEQHAMYNANTHVKFPSAVVYSVCLFEKNDFHGMSRRMEEGTGKDRSIRKRKSADEDSAISKNIQEQEKHDGKQKKNHNRTGAHVLSQKHEETTYLEYCILYGAQLDYNDVIQGSSTNVANMAWKRIFTNLKFGEQSSQTNYITPTFNRSASINSSVTNSRANSAVDLSLHEEEEEEEEGPTRKDEEFEKLRAQIFKDDTDEDSFN